MKDKISKYGKSITISRKETNRYIKKTKYYKALNKANLLMFGKELVDLR